MTVIDVTAALDSLGGGTPARARFTALASRPRVDGATVLHPADVVVDLHDGTPVEPIDLEPPGPDWFWRVELEFPTVGRSSRSIRRYVQFPDTGTVTWEDLVDVDPETYEPVPAAPSVAEQLADMQQQIDELTPGGDIDGGTP